MPQERGLPPDPSQDTPMESPPVRCEFSRLVAPGDLRPNPRNPQKHPKRQLDLYVRILEHQGWRRSVVVSRQSGLIVCGHGAVLAAKAAGWSMVPVDDQDFASPADETAHMLADNQLPQMAELDDKVVSELLEDLEGKIDAELTGIDAAFNFEIPTENKPIDEQAMGNTCNECPKCGFKW